MKLGLNHLTDRKCNIQNSVFTQAGDAGLDLGMDWLLSLNLDQATAVEVSENQVLATVSKEWATLSTHDLSELVLQVSP